jgi:hypothetical protein
VKESNPLPVYRYIDILKPSIPSTSEGDRENILRIGRKHVVDYNATTGSIRSSFHVVPRVLRNILRKLISWVYSWSIPITHSPSAYLTRCVEIRLQ